MRLKTLLRSLAAFAAFPLLGACSSDAPDSPGNKENQTFEGEGYIAINIKTAGIEGTRADSDETLKYQAGSDAESLTSYNNVRFYFFDEDGSAFNMNVQDNENGSHVSNSVTPIENLTEKPGNSDGETVSGEAILVLGKAANEGYKGMVPYQAVCVANLTEDEFEALEGKTLAELAKTINEFTPKTVQNGETKEVDDYTPSQFVMSNSNYDGAQDYGAVLLAGHIFNDPEPAKTAPINFYIERLAVKVTVESGLKSHTSLVKSDDGYKEAEYTIFKANGSQETVKLNVKLQDWALINRAEESYLIKKLPSGTPFDGWSPADLNRCFWAESSVESMEREEFDIIDGDNWSDKAKYCYEFTNGTAIDEFDRTATTTGIVIRGYVQYQDGQNVNLCRWGGSYYEKLALQELIASASPKSISANDVEFIHDGNKNTYKAVIKNSSIEGGYENLGFKNIQLWDNGATSFYVNIKDDKAADFGVVRNHIYSYTFDNVVGLGIPGNGPDDPEDDETFVAATVNVVNWRVVSNTVTLQ